MGVKHVRHVCKVMRQGNEPKRENPAQLRNLSFLIPQLEVSDDTDIDLIDLLLSSGMLLLTVRSIQLFRPILIG